MKKIWLVCLFLSGCTASFNPYPSYTKQEIEGFFQNVDKNFALLDGKIGALAEAVVKPKAKKVQPKLPEVEAEKK